MAALAMAAFKAWVISRKLRELLGELKRVAS